MSLIYKKLYLFILCVAVMNLRLWKLQAECILMSP